MSTYLTELDRERRPLAVRSSSFLEDNLKHSFAGIYSSYFIPNRGTDAGVEWLGPQPSLVPWLMTPFSMSLPSKLSSSSSTP